MDLPNAKIRFACTSIAVVFAVFPIPLITPSFSASRNAASIAACSVISFPLILGCKHLQHPEYIPQRRRLLRDPARIGQMPSFTGATIEPEVHCRKHGIGNRYGRVFFPDVVADLPRPALPEVLRAGADAEGGAEFFSVPTA